MIEPIREELAQRLRERRSEIEQAALARVHAVADPGEVEDPEYAVGLRKAVGTALEYAVGGIETKDLEPVPVPDGLLAQARAAARNDVGLDTVLRRYFAGYILLGDFLMQEVEKCRPFPDAELKYLLRTEGAIFNRLVALIAAEYSRVSEGRPGGDEQRRMEQVRKLLAGELVDSADIAYELGASHIGAIGTGPDARVAMRDLAAALDRRLLMVCAGDGVVWAWLGGRQQVSSREVLRLSRSSWPAHGTLALGEPGQGIEGWRLTHKQARAAMSIAARRPETVVHYAEVALLTAAAADEVLTCTLTEAYLAPLEMERDGGVALRETLRAYFSAERNVTSAAAALGVSRPTVKSRLYTVEKYIGHPVGSCAAEIETALRLWDLNDIGRRDLQI